MRLSDDMWWVEGDGESPKMIGHGKRSRPFVPRSRGQMKNLHEGQAPAPPGRGLFQMATCSGRHRYGTGATRMWTSRV